MSRWTLTLLLKPLDWVFTILQLLYFPYFWFKVRSKEKVNVEPKPVWKFTDIRIKAFEIQPNQFGIVGKETHCLLEQSGVGLIRPDLIPTLLQSTVKPSGSIYRGINDDGTEKEPYMGPSRDGLTSWVHAYILWNAQEKQTLKRLTDHYLKNCFGLLWEERGGVSARGSNGGIAPVVDGFPVGKKWWPFKQGLNSPLTGQDCLTTLALLALAGRELGFKYKVIYWLYSIISLAPIHALIPVMYTKKDDLYYVHHIAALNAWNLVKLGHPMYKWSLKYICDYVSPRGSLQPWITGLAIDCGLMLDKKEDVRELLMSYTAPVKWPQYRLTSQKSFNHKPGNTWDMMYYAEYLLR